MLGEDLALAASKTTKNQIFKVKTLMTCMLSTYMALHIVIYQSVHVTCASFSAWTVGFSLYISKDAKFLGFLLFLEPVDGKGSIMNTEIVSLILLFFCFST